MIAVLPLPAASQTPATASVSLNIEQQSIADLQGRFLKLQQVARPNGGSFELQLVDAEQSLLRQRNDGIVRLPKDRISLIPDDETLDFLMLLGLVVASTPEAPRKGPSTAARAITGAIGFIGVNAVRISAQQPIAIRPHFESAKSSERRDKALIALSWAVTAGGCEARIVSSLRKLEAVHGAVGIDARQILNDLGSVAWTPDDRCSPAAR